MSQRFKFHDHVQIGLSIDTVCGESLNTIILRHSDATSITDVSVRNCNKILNRELEEWEHEYNQYLDSIKVYN